MLQDKQSHQKLFLFFNKELFKKWSHSPPVHFLKKKNQIEYVINLKIK